jgi:hypothetical protein
MLSQWGGSHKEEAVELTKYRQVCLRAAVAPCSTAFTSDDPRSAGMVLVAGPGGAVVCLCLYMLSPSLLSIFP